MITVDEYNDYISTIKTRENKVVKHNDLVQKSRFNLSLVEQKTINYLVSLIKPADKCPDGKQPIEYEFEIIDYCKTCGIDYDNGKNYITVKNTLKSLRDKSVYMSVPGGGEVTVSWLIKVFTNKRTGRARIWFDPELTPYIFELRENTTRFELLNILSMKSKYSVRMYEICRSWAGLKGKTYAIEDLRSLLSIGEGELVNFKDFRRRVLEISEREINENTDLNVGFEYITKGRKVTQVKIKISEKTQDEKNSTAAKVNRELMY